MKGSTVSRQVLRHTVDIREEFTLPDGMIVMFGRSLKTVFPEKLDVWVEQILWEPPVPVPEERLRRFEVFGTGGRLPIQGVWLQSFHDERFGRVWHLYQMAPGVQE